MPGEERSSKTYMKIIGGNIHIKCEPNEPGATIRVHEKQDGTKVEYVEKIYESWSGKIKAMRFNEGKFGTTLEIEFSDGILQISKNSKYFNDTIGKLANADLSKSTVFAPVEYPNKKKPEKKVQYMNVIQHG